jgi:N-methylhydantoinase B
MTFKNIGQSSYNARVRPDKIFCAPPGLNGGQPGKTGEVRFNGEVITRFPILKFNPGDEIELRMPGGAGFGAVAERQKKLILEDIALGYVSLEGAKRDYGLTLEPLKSLEGSAHGT